MKAFVSLISLSMLLMCSFQVTAFTEQHKSVPNVLGEIITMPSKALSQDRSIQVYLPASYHDSSKEYPVLYVLDGQWHFINAVAIQKSVKAPGTLPEMIVVGFVNSNPLRRKLFGGEKDKFKRYLTDEVLPFVDAQYRTSKERIIFGWEMSAFFASFAVFDQEQLFDGVILTNGGEISEQEIAQFNQLKNKREHYLYIANSIKDIYTINYSDALSKILTEKADKTLHWNYEKFNDETHQTLPYIAMYQGLKHYYHNFSTLSFSNINEFETLGGMSYLTDYFVKRSKRFGVSPNIPNGTKNHLIWLSWKQDNYEYFDKFMVAFSDVLLTKRYDSIFWQNNFGRFYLKHKNLNAAKHYFDKAIIKFPDSALLHQGLAKVYLAKGEADFARQSFSQAIILAKASNDIKLSEYKADLAKMK